MFFKRYTWIFLAVPSTFVLKCKHWLSAIEQINECGVFTKWNAILYAIKSKPIKLHTKIEMNFTYIMLSQRTPTPNSASHINPLYKLQEHLYNVVKLIHAIRSWVSGYFWLSEVTEKLNDGSSGC